VVSGSELDDVREVETKASPFVDVIVDEQGQLAEHYGIRQTPTLLLFGPTQRLRASYDHLANVPLAARLVEVTDTGRELATSYDVVVNVPEGDEARAQGDLKAVREQVRKWEAQLSEWRKDSEVTQFNEQAAKGPTKVSPSLMQIVRGAVNVANATHGAFDITWRPLDALWHQAEQSGQLPSPDEIHHVLEAVGPKNLIVEGQTIAFKHPKTQIGIAGVGKGWIVDSTFLELERRGYADILVNIGGDLRTMGREPDGTKHVLQVIDPYHPSLVRAQLEIENAGVATSGNYIRQRYVGDKVVGHIFDPRTGLPPKFDGSTTVIAPDAAMADALATGLFVMGPEEGTAFAKQHPGVDVLYVGRQGVTGTITVRQGAPLAQANAAVASP
jgi:thiamine biosynthesis lipoprotein